jgi:hypothetical protein
MHTVKLMLAMPVTLAPVLSISRHTIGTVFQPLQHWNTTRHQSQARVNPLSIGAAHICAKPLHPMRGEKSLVEWQQRVMIDQLVGTVWYAGWKPGHQHIEVARQINDRCHIVCPKYFLHKDALMRVALPMLHTGYDAIDDFIWIRLRPAGHHWVFSLVLSAVSRNSRGERI